MKVVSWSRKVLPLFVVLGLYSCDDDFTTVGSGIVGDENMNAKTYSVQNVVAYSRATGPIQSNGFMVNSLGVIDNPVFGKSVVSYVTQLEFPAGTNPTADIVSPTVTRVELTIPYFSTLKETDENGNRTFELDSLYGKTGKFKLDIYESGYYLRDFDPSTNFEEVQKYYTDLYNEINNAKIPFGADGRLNNSTDVAQNDEFYFSSAEHIIYEIDDDGEEKIKERVNPQMKIELNKNFFQEKIFHAPAGQMDSENAFKNYFRGLFFRVEDIGQGSHLMQLDFSKGKITVYYTTPIEDEEKTLVLNLGGHRVSLVQNQFSSEYQNALTSSNPIFGDEKLYIKGSEGSLAYINLFGDTDSEGVSEELESLRETAENENWLINEAYLMVYVDKSQMDQLENVPLRIYLFDAINNTPLIDYNLDGTTYGDPKGNKYVFGGFLFKEEGKEYYKIRITGHIKNLIKNKDAKNVTLGLSVTESINILGMATLKDGIGLPDTSPYRYAPFSSAMNPLGTILYGTNTLETDKKLRLEILYTKP